MAFTNDQLLVNFRNLEYIKDNWLHHFSVDYKNGSIYPVAKQMTDNLKTLINQGKFVETWNIYDKLDELARSLGTSEEIGDVKVVCAWIETRIGRFSTAYNLLIDANKWFLDQHDIAVTIWMMGIVLWHTDDDLRWDAVEYWEICRKSFQNLQVENRLGQTSSAWYKNLNNEIDRFLEIIKKDPSLQVSAAHLGFRSRPYGFQRCVTPIAVPPGPPNRPLPGQNLPATPPADGQAVPPSSNRPKEQAPTSPAGWLRIFKTLQGQVHAGELSVVESSSAGFIDVTEVVIGKTPYRVVSLDSYDSLINLLSVKSPDIIQVTGDSMDAYPIESGDYIIIKRVEINPFKDKSLSGKVILTSTYEKDGKAETNIKILRYFGATPHLEYMSESKKHKEGYQNKTIPFEKSWKIIGVVIGRLTSKSDIS